MTRIATTLALIAAAGAAHAHPGHLAEAGGHDHWALIGGIALIAIAAPIAIRAFRRK